MNKILNFKKKFDKIFINFLKKELKNNYFQNQDLKKNINHIINIAQNGKRIRPFAFYTILKANNKKFDKKAISIAIAFEILHLFAIIQDDVMDKTKLRRDTSTLHYFIYKNNKINKKTDKLHYANSQTILLSDLLFNIFYKIIFQTEKNIKNQFNLMVKEVVFGQYLDLYLSNSPNLNPSLKLIKIKTNLKTSYYTFVRPFIIGCLYCKEKKQNIKLIEKIGCLIGEIFQIQDDLFDYNINIKNSKDKFNDIKEGQKTFLSYHILKNNKLSKIFKKLFYKKLNNQQQKLLQKIIKESKTDKFILNKIKNNYIQVKKLIKKIKNQKLQNELNNILNLVYKRNE
ncbi:MAG: polyprenyl synthetase family protein [Patescibacteria group bacterium]|nr:polyprenyl synthetase family protein [Patescibacteria group bacterium]